MTSQDTHAETFLTRMAEGQPLVRSLAVLVLRRLPMRVDLDDLVAYGQLGLAEAARQFDASRGCRFTTFAYYRVKGAIYDGVSKMSWTSRGRLNRARFQRLREFGEEPPSSEEQNGVSQMACVTSDQAMSPMVRVFLTNRYDPNAGGQGDVDVEDTGSTPAAQIANQEIVQRLHELVAALPRLRRVLIETVYHEGATIQEAAVHLGISKSWASRVHAQTLDGLSRALRRIGAD